MNSNSLSVTENGDKPPSSALNGGDDPHLPMDEDMEDLLEHIGE